MTSHFLGSDGWRTRLTVVLVAAMTGLLAGIYAHKNSPAVPTGQYSVIYHCQQDLDYCVRTYNPPTRSFIWWDLIKNGNPYSGPLVSPLGHAYSWQRVAIPIDETLAGLAIKYQDNDPDVSGGILADRLAGNDYVIDATTKLK